MIFNITKTSQSTLDGVLKLRKLEDCTSRVRRGVFSVSYRESKISEGLDNVAEEISDMINGTYSIRRLELTSIPLVELTAKQPNVEYPISQEEFNYLVNKVYSK